MLGKHIAENLRQNREKWTRHYYHKEGAYCVLGLKLKELGVEVEKFGGINDMCVSKLGINNSAIPNFDLLIHLQEANDAGFTADGVISYVDQNPDVNYPIEELAAALKAQGY